MSDAVWLAIVVAISGGFTAWLSYLTSRAAKHEVVVTGKLDQIHELTNSNMSAQMQDTLSSKMAQLATLDQLLTLQQTDGKKVNGSVRTTRDLLARQISELEIKLEERAKSTEIANSKVANNT